MAELGSASLWGAIYLLSTWVIRVGALIVVPFRRSPNAAVGWLLLFFILPWPALILYLIIGRPVHPHWRRELVRRLPEVLKRAAGRTRRPPRDAACDLPAELAPAARLAQAIGRLPPLDGNAIDLLSEYDEVTARLCADIDAARNHVHLLFYIFAHDTTGRQVMAALERAARRGVACRVLIDAVGSRRHATTVLARLHAAGVEAHRILPVRFFQRTTRIDLRNHRKIAVIDGCFGYTGSQNIIDAEFAPGRRNRELVVRIRGAAVAALQAVFIADWYLETGDELGEAALFPEPEEAGGVVAQVLPSGPDLPDAGIDELLVTLVHGARERVVLTTPYFVPSSPLLQAVRIAVLRGVDVHLVVSRDSDSPLVWLAQRSYYSELMAAGVTIHLFRPAFLHAKHVSIDSRVALIGSSNLDIRSFELNAEISLICYDREFTTRLEAIEQECFLASEAVDRATWGDRPLPMKVFENIARLLSPLL